MARPSLKISLRKHTPKGTQMKNHTPAEQDTNTHIPKDADTSLNDYSKIKTSY